MAILETTLGPLEEDTLEKKVLTHDRPRGQSTWTEYYKDGQLVRRDIHNRAFSDVELAERARQLKGEVAP